MSSADAQVEALNDQSEDPADLHQRADPQLGGSSTSSRSAASRRRNVSGTASRSTIRCRARTITSPTSRPTRCCSACRRCRSPLTGWRRATRRPLDGIRWWTISFEDMEREIRDLLGRALKDGGFDPARDIEAITCNRWSHGYALEYMRPWDTRLAGRSAAHRDVAQGLETCRYRQFGCGRLCLRAFGDRPGRACDQGAAWATRPNLPEFADFPGPPRDQIGLSLTSIRCTGGRQPVGREKSLWVITLALTAGGWAEYLANASPTGPTSI